MAGLGLIFALGAVSARAAPSHAHLQAMVSHRTFLFFRQEPNPVTGLTKDRARNLDGPDPHTVASVAATGYALASLPIAAQNHGVTLPECLGHAGAPREAATWPVIGYTVLKFALLFKEPLD